MIKVDIKWHFYASDVEVSIYDSDKNTEVILSHFIKDEDEVKIIRSRFETLFGSENVKYVYVD